MEHSNHTLVNCLSRMVISALGEAKKNNIPIARIHSGSVSALCGVLEEHYPKEQR